jgi:hypothetical protein
MYKIEVTYWFSSLVEKNTCNKVANNFIHLLKHFIYVCVRGVSKIVEH